MLNYVPRVSQTPDAQAARRLETSLGVTPIMARLLLQRGLDTPEAARDYLSASLTQLHDPMDLLDMDRAVTRIRQAVAQGERITIFGDYDVDGVCATSVLMLYLRSLGAQVERQSFYEALGFSPVGEVFLDCGQPHIEMRRAL